MPRVNNSLISLEDLTMKRLFPCSALVMFFLLSFPALVTNESRNIAGISAVAQAGRTVPNMAFCECGTSGCVCDPGESPCTTCPNQGMTMQPSTTPEAEPADIDTGTGLTLLVTTVLLVLRLRQII